MAKVRWISSERTMFKWWMW